MRHIRNGFCLVGGAALVVQGFRLLFSASRSNGWDAAMPALFGVICFIAAAVLLAPRLVGIIAHPVTSLVGGLFYPQVRFTAPPDSHLVALRARIVDGQFKAANQQITALFDAYGPSAGLYHLRALLEASQGRDPKPVTIEASRTLSAPAFDVYLELLRKFPATPRI